MTGKGEQNNNALVSESNAIYTSESDLCGSTAWHHRVKQNSIVRSSKWSSSVAPRFGGRFDRVVVNQHEWPEC
jgi:hypothetical protein